MDASNASHADSARKFTPRPSEKNGGWNRNTGIERGTDVRVFGPSPKDDRNISFLDGH
ncbi:hypothetical protein SCOR_29040 [Sulfidibacter corallicola]|uniref:Uncharacterized protein n=1 Tax=Sulfidibacter corallicola TaxID=2818388 RepID=A0A8A4TN89_SULCO|nr:hypothetical protein [Sulfidibacter corallicola]QTD50398.1 hypothetical protein J3U87_32845 [Sulfidibacter corallicola]